MSMKDNLSHLMKEAQKMQEKMQQTQKELELMTVVGEAGTGSEKVRVTMTGRHDAKKVEISPNLIKLEEKEILEDLVAAAINDAVRKIEKETRTRMSGLTSGLNLPEGFKSPFGE